MTHSSMIRVGLEPVPSFRQIKLVHPGTPMHVRALEPVGGDADLGNGWAGGSRQVYMSRASE